MAIFPCFHVLKKTHPKHERLLEPTELPSPATGRVGGAVAHMAQAGLCSPTTRSPRVRSHCQGHIAHARSFKSQCRSGCCSTWYIAGCGFWDLSLPLVLLKICALDSRSSTQSSHRDCTEGTSETSLGPWAADQSDFTLSLRTVQLLSPQSLKFLFMGAGSSEGYGSGMHQTPT